MCEFVTITYHNMVVVDGEQHFYPFHTITKLFIYPHIYELLDDCSGSDYDVNSFPSEDLQS